MRPVKYLLTDSDVVKQIWALKRKKKYSKTKEKEEFYEAEIERLNETIGYKYGKKKKML